MSAFRPNRASRAIVMDGKKYDQHEDYFQIGRTQQKLSNAQAHRHLNNLNSIQTKQSQKHDEQYENGRMSKNSKQKQLKFTTIETGLSCPPSLQGKNYRERISSANQQYSISKYSEIGFQDRKSSTEQSYLVEERNSKGCQSGDTFLQKLTYYIDTMTQTKKQHTQRNKTQSFKDHGRSRSYRVDGFEKKKLQKSRDLSYKQKSICSEDQKQLLKEQNLHLKKIKKILQSRLDQQEQNSKKASVKIFTLQQSVMSLSHQIQNLTHTIQTLLIPPAHQHPPRPKTHTDSMDAQQLQNLQKQYKIFLNTGHIYPWGHRDKDTGKGWV